MKLRVLFSASIASVVLSVLAVTDVQGAAAPYAAWPRSGTFTLLTTPEGANLPASASVEQFPVLVRLSKDWFDFSQARSKGEDVRFSTESGEPLAFEIEHWDAAAGTAAIWVRIPKITGNSAQTIRMFWGKPDAGPESNAKAVFNDSNKYLSVFHLSADVNDATGMLTTKDVGTTPAPGLIGGARHLAGKQGISGGENITTYPTGSAPSTTQAWVRVEKSNSTIIGWGIEKGQSKFITSVRSPAQIYVDSYFGEGIEGKQRVPLNEWMHVVHVYSPGASVMYVNGVPYAEGPKKGAMNFPSPARLYIGGWYNNYTFIGDIDEVRVSSENRSPDWVRLEYENQKAFNTLVGPLIQTGNTFAVTPEKASVEEGKTLTVSAQAGGARKLYWVLKRDGREEVVAADTFHYTFDAGRVAADTPAVLQLKAVYPTGVKTKEIALTVKKTIPEPVFTLAAPAAWDGRKPIKVVPQITNLAAMNAKGAGKLKVEWSAGPMAIIKEALPEKMVLKRAQNSGKLVVTAKISNGGAPVTQSCTINVTEPASDAWVERVPGKDEKPEEGQFYARDPKNEGTLFYNGTLTAPADSVFLKLYADDKLVKTETAKPAADNSYKLSAKLKPGLIKYRVEFGTISGGKETVVEKVGDIVCGDAYLIDGQSNALATDTREESEPVTNEWIRSYGLPPGKPAGTSGGDGNLWCRPVWKARKGEKAELGWWGMELAKRLVESQKVPIFIINGARGGTRIDQHQRNPADPTDMESIYGRMLWRVQHAKMTHSIRAVIWHQGENDQGADGPTGGYGWENYQSLFVEMAAGWKTDFPNVQHYYMFQIWPSACAMGRDGHGDRLREKQRTMPQLFSKMSIMSTLGIKPEGGCHYPLAGWSEFARLLQPMIERDFYNKKPAASITPPNLVRASFTGVSKDSVTLEFDQPVVWNDTLAGQFYLDDEKDQVASGSVSGNVLTLKLKAPSKAKTITYLKEASWKPDTLLRGANEIAALTFCEVALGESR